MGKPLISQRRGKGGVFKAPSHRFKTKVRYRNVDELEKKSVRCEVIDLVDDPARSVILVSLKYSDGKKLLLPAVEGAKVGDIFEEGELASLSIGNVLPVGKIPEGYPVFNIEVKPGDGGRLARASGSFCFIVTKERRGVTIKLPSGQMKIFNPKCRAMIGCAAGGGRAMKPVLRAGTKYYKRKARGQLFPIVRGVKMSAYDHPFGGKQHHGAKTKKGKGGSPGQHVGSFGARRTGKRKKKK